VFAHTNFLAVPNAPANFVSTAYGPYTIELSWDAVAGADQYRIERSFNNVDWTIATTFPAGYTAWSDGYFAPETTVYHRVAAHNEAGWSAYSYASAQTAPLLPPSAPPTNLHIDSAVAGSVVLTWNDNANNE